MTNWKKGLALLLVLLLSVTAFAACGNGGNGAPVETLTPDTVMIEVTGATPVLWEEMYYDLQMMRHNIEQFSGPIVDWDALVEGSLVDWEEITYREFVMQHAINMALERRAVEVLWSGLGETIDESVYGEAREQYLAMFAVDEEGFAELLEENFLTESVLRLLTEFSHKEARFAEELMNDESLLDPAAFDAFVEENEILRAKHILLQTTNIEEEDEEIRAAADALYEELQDLSGEELLTRFTEMMEAYGEDPGMDGNPEGYTFIEGVMVAEFFEATLATAINEVTEPVRSNFGYHIILRLPVEPSANLMVPGGLSMTVGQAATAEYAGQAIENAREGLEYTLTQSLEQLDLSVLFGSENMDEEMAEDAGEEDIEE